MPSQPHRGADDDAPTGEGGRPRRSCLPAARNCAEVDGRAIAVFNVDGAFYAIDDVCTHDGGPLAEGELWGCEIQCPRHGARFDVRTGKPLCMPAFEPVTTHDVELPGRRRSRRSWND